jgi:hypothetical protein
MNHHRWWQEIRRTLTTGAVTFDDVGCSSDEDGDRREPGSDRDNHDYDGDDD